MSAPPEPTLIVSPRIYALILSSPRLKRLLLPEGFICSPYHVLDYDITLVLEDTRGSEAVYRRRQRIQYGEPTSFEGKVPLRTATSTALRA